MILLYHRRSRQSTPSRAQLLRHNLVYQEHARRIRHHSQQVRCQTAIQARKALLRNDEPKSLKQARVFELSVGSGLPQTGAHDFVRVCDEGGDSFSTAGCTHYAANVRENGAPILDIRRSRLAHPLESLRGLSAESAVSTDNAPRIKPIG